MTDNDKQSNTVVKDTELSIGDRIQKKRKELALSVEDLAALTAQFDYSKIENEKGLSSQTLYRYEKNEREPGAREIRLLCYSLNVSADWLIFGKLWNAEQEEDSKLAGKLRALVEEASDLTNINRFLSATKSRNEMHQIKLMEVKNNKK